MTAPGHQPHDVALLPRTSLRTSVVLAIALLATMSLVRSSQAASPTQVQGTDPRAQALLARAVNAEDAFAYAGVEYMSAGDSGASVVVDVTHVPGRGTLLVEDADDGNPAKAAFSGAADSRPNLLLALLGRSYRLVLGPDAVVAGRTAQLVVAQRPDGVVAARFWIDRGTGLLLRRDLLGGDGSVVRRAEFVQLAMGAAVSGHLPAMLPSPGGRALDDGDLDDWRGRGWPCPHVLGGLSLFDARTVPDSGAARLADTVLHLSYSDGLSTVSVFVQQGRLPASLLTSAKTATVGGHIVRVLGGSPRQLVWESGGYVVTVVADAPADVVAGVVAGLPHLPQTVTGWSRVERGVGRVISWLDPFD